MQPVAASDACLIGAPYGTAAAATSRHDRRQTRLHGFGRRAEMAGRNRYDGPYRNEVAGGTNRFPDMDYRIFQGRPWL